MTVLVISQQQDLTADQVVVRLHARKVPVVRFDFADFPGAVTFHATTGKGWSGVVDVGHHRFDFADVDAVYYRRPTGFRMPDGMSVAESEWAVREARAGFGGVLTSLDCRWVNHPDRNAAATKPIQLVAAAAGGLNVPRTIITNSPEQAAAFVASCPGGAVYKPMSGSPAGVPGQAIYTQVVAGEESFTAITATAHQLQELLPKAYEVRITVIGGRMFGTRIDAGSEAARLDWRTDYAALTFTTVDIPDDVRLGIRWLMNQLGLRFGALDFVVDPGGTWWFLEVNPNGQWGFVEQATGQPIADAIAADLQGDPT